MTRLRGPAPEVKVRQHSFSWCLMRLTRLSLALFALLPLSALAQTQVVPGVTVYPGGTGNVFGTGGAINAPGLNAGLTQPVQPPQPDRPPSNEMSSPSVTEGSSEVPSALDQGLNDGPSPEEVRRAMAEAAARSTPRQKGIVVPAPTLGNPVGKDVAARGWLANWELALTRLGMSPNKFWFEANRLSRSDFEAWASRQMRFRQSQGAQVDVLERPAVDLLTSPIQ